MTLNLVALYSFAVAAITMLGLFARQNRKTGWVKQRKTFVADLLALQSEWDAIDREIAGQGQWSAPAVVAASAPAVAAPAAPAPVITAESQANFSLTLAQLQRALNHPTVQPTVTPAVEKAEKVLA